MIDLQHQLEQAKQALNRAAADCLKNVPGAAERADAANAEVQSLQALQRRGAPGRARLCEADGCTVITLEPRCWRHRQAG